MRDERSLQPWTRGPFELIRHADSHARDADDTSRRIALIGFDQAIEVAVDVFVRLDPLQRGQRQIGREEQERVRLNFREKLAFLDRLAAETGRPLGVSVPVMIFYHQIRNEMYHSGNGVTPETRVVEGARAAAIATFNALFSEDIEPMLSSPRSSGEALSGRAVQGALPLVSPSSTSGSTDRTEAATLLLQALVEFEDEIRKLMPGSSVGSLKDAWGDYRSQHPELASTVGREVTQALSFRNEIVHMRLDLEALPADLLLDRAIVVEEATRSIRRSATQWRDRSPR